jgi:CO dehydrogenase maturation factor
MGLFHCPLGAAYYEDEPCIDCGLCIAVTEEDIFLASNKIKEHYRSLGEAKKGSKRKIAICGKGGAGKSTFSVLLANAFQKLGYRVLIIDTDESSSGLYRMFGFTQHPWPLTRALEKVPKGGTISGMDWMQQPEISLENIPVEYLAVRNELNLLVAGKIINPFQGCACSIADLVRVFVRKLVLKEKEILLIDTEAGVESFGRGVERETAAVLITVEPSSESLNLAEKIKYMAEGLGVKTVRAILNKIPSEKVENRMTEEIEKRRIRVIGSICHDNQISEANLEGDALPVDSIAHNAVKEIATRLLSEIS